VNGDAQAVPKFAWLMLASLQADVARGRGIRNLARVSDLLAATGARTYATDAARWLPELTAIAELVRADDPGASVRSVGTGVVKRGARRGEEFVLVETDRATYAYAHRPGTDDVRLAVHERPSFPRAKKRLDRLVRLARRPPRVPRPREQRTPSRPRRIRVHSGSRGDPPDGESDDDDPHDPARRAHPAGARPDPVVARRRQ
jgi:hypothetical protein